MKNGPVRVGIIGSQFQADCHATAIGMIEEDMSVVAVASPTASHAQGFADRHRVARVYHDYKELAKDAQVEAVTITAPNALHCEMTLAMAQAGKHVICEKPLCVTLDEADRMIAACRANGVLLLYAESLLFTPKYVRAKEMADSGAFGKVHLIKQSEKHFGPHAEWFWDVKRAGVVPCARVHSSHGGPIHRFIKSDGLRSPSSASCPFQGRAGLWPAARD